MINEYCLDIYNNLKLENIIIIITNTPNNQKIEEIDGNTTETFTLEEFRTLILDSRLKNVDLILARVVTADINDNQSNSTFYYLASEFNKLLYKNESENKLMHRFDIKNPLNNLNIKGQVYYYKLTVDEIDKSIENYYLHNKKDILTYSATFFATEDDFMKKKYLQDYFKKNRLNLTDEFLFETNMKVDFEEDEGFTWKRIFTIYFSILLILLGINLTYHKDCNIMVCINPILLVFCIPLSCIIFFSFFGLLIGSAYVIKFIYENFMV